MGMGEKNPNMSRGKNLDALEKAHAALREKRATMPSYVTGRQLLAAIENRFGVPFGDLQADIFYDYYTKFHDQDCSAQDRKTFLSLFLHFSNKLTQNAPQQIEMEDVKDKMSTDEIKARAAQIALNLLNSENAQ